MLTHVPLQLLKWALAHGPARLEAAAHALRDYRRRFGRYPNILAPRGFNAKIMRRRLFDRTEVFNLWADKAATRRYVTKLLGSDYLPDLYYLTPDPATIPWETLPQRYVIKASHGSEWVRIVHDAAAVNRAALLAQCNAWLGSNYYDQHHELIYRTVPPQIIIEEFLDDGHGESAWDYKCYTYHGEVRFVQVDAHRFSGERRNLYDRDWNLLPVQLGVVPNYPDVIPRPARFAEMLDVARVLAGEVDFVRVDLYHTDRGIYVGELTSSCCGGLNRFYPPSFDLTFGAPWKRR